MKMPLRSIAAWPAAIVLCLSLGAAPQPAAAQGPLGIVACFMTLGDVQSTTGVQITFVNESSHPIHHVRFVVEYRGARATAEESGTYMPGVRVSRHFWILDNRPF